MPCRCCGRLHETDPPVRSRRLASSWLCGRSSSTHRIDGTLMSSGNLPATRITTIDAAICRRPCRRWQDPSGVPANCFVHECISLLQFGAASPPERIEGAIQWRRISSAEAADGTDKCFSEGASRSVYFGSARDRSGTNLGDRLRHLGLGKVGTGSVESCVTHTRCSIISIAMHPTTRRSDRSSLLAMPPMRIERRLKLS